VVLRLEHARDPAIRIEGHVCPVEAADADVEDSRRKRCAVVVRYRDAETFG
jgi:hypothetical protein